MALIAALLREPKPSRRSTKAWVRFVIGFIWSRPFLGALEVDVDRGLEDAGSLNFHRRVHGHLRGWRSC